MRTRVSWWLCAALVVLPLLAPAQTPVRKVPGTVGLPLVQPWYAELDNKTFSRSLTGEGVAWRCSKGHCQANAALRDTPVQVCAALFAQAGAVRTFDMGKRRLDANELARCNGRAPAALRQVATVPAGSKAAPPQSKPQPQPQPQLQPQLARPVAVPVSPQLQAAVRRKGQLFGDLRAKIRQAEAQSETPAARNQRVEQERLARGYTVKHGQGTDCDDHDRGTHPFANDICDYKDNNCDGAIDEGQRLLLFLDADGDAHGDPRQGAEVCPADQTRAVAEGRWLVPSNNDCDDSDPTRWMGCE
jgi:hypothetical protein